MRIYDPRVGRFLSVDPIGGEYPWNSSYAYAENDVVRSIDIGSHVATLVGAGALVKAELKGLSAELSAEAKLATGEASLNKNCFVAGTKILTNNGFKTIENIQVEDSVWAFNDVTRKKELKIVTALSKKEVKKLIRLSFENEVLYATPEHPFWINNTWVLAKNIQYGDSLTLFSNRKCAVAIKNELDTSAFVYNFTVSEFHSYFVSSLGVLVHNTCFEPVKFTGKGAGRFNTEITEVAAGRGNQIFKADGSPQIFEGRTASNGKDWIGAIEYKVDPPKGVENIYRILKKQIGVNSAGEPIYKYGYSTDHYQGTIHSYKEIPSSTATAGGTGGTQ
ncbi:intein C-terminal splicing region/intein N-terminal splicing region/RHS repeat-associated core domain-containing protein [Chitinophaga rupis]|uniref:Intein C-terminal splicing region/intein N-terminal splicing region/RHS repeat-associated core domain-containing protein n=1 Tax=Chitinophaga rupis TaxID=573321 RepID=A0A1H8F734_9BACT|nr:polymorphic toxin-type HINT domain-containing protein [Chitinophaga rupis]SEN27455.1 intein C-terminal splicing region/intein N-terminal splicing region/RHS repeat-associated core domain-containing protein [Chitinophaga rupis]